MVEFREIENMRLRQNGCGNIQLVTNFDKIIEKFRIGEFILPFIYVLFADATAFDKFSPNSHTSIIHNIFQKVNCLKTYFYIFSNRVERRQVEKKLLIKKDKKSFSF